MKLARVIEIVGQKNMPEFFEFMNGQTVGINPDGSTDYYAWDVERFCSQLPRKDIEDY